MLQNIPYTLYMNNRPFQGVALSALLVSRFESTGTCIFIGQGHIIRGWGVLIDNWG